MDLRPPTMKIGSDAPTSWPKFKQAFDVFIAASGIEADQSRKCNLLLHCMGQEGIDIYNTFEIKKGDENKFRVLINKFDEYFIPKVNITYERYKFFTRSQKPGEKFDNYVTDLKMLASTCEFKNLKDGLIRDRIICGIEHNKLREKLLSHGDLTLEKCIDICKSKLAAEYHVRDIDTIQEPIKVNKINKVKGKMEHKELKTIKDCTRCGLSHPVNKCPAYKATCAKCKKKNHFAKMCRQKQIKQIEVTEADQNEDSDEMIFVGAVEDKDKPSLTWSETLELKTKPKVMLKCKLDTGAEASIIPNHAFKKIPNIKLEKSNVRLVNYNGSKIINCGQCILPCELKNGKTVNLQFFVVETEENSPIVLGQKHCVELNLIKRINNVTNKVSCNNLLLEFTDVFNGIGCLKNEHKIIIDENAVPTVYTARKIPLSVQGEVKTEINKLEKAGIISKVSEPTDWVHPLVIVRKPNGKIRLCLDPKQLNKVIKREYYQIPTIEEILSQLSGAKVFSLLDANQGFYQIPLEESSKKLCTFATPFGRYMFNRLPFGIASAPEIFQKQFRQVFEDIPGQISYIDDLLVFGKNQEEHDRNLKMVLEKARIENIKFNKSKCKFSLNEIKFVGHIIGSSGVRADDEKIESIINMAEPKCKKELEQFLGMVTYVAKFIPNLSDRTSELRQLLNKSSVFHWDENHSRAFKKLKETLTKTPVLQYFNVNKPVIISVDASKDGLGAVLLQDNLPVIYASRTLNETEKRYAQIEKELLAVLFGCTRFHQYIYGKQIIIESDHKPLVSIHEKPLINSPLRLQRMLIKLQLYDLEIRYKPGSQLYIADCLSRNFLNKINANDELTLSEIEAHVDLIEKVLPVSDAKFEEFQVETKKDSSLSELIKIVKEGWPNKKDNLSPDLQQYWNYRNEIVSINDVLFKGRKVIVPSSMRMQMLNIIHYNHLGVVKCQLRARECLYWPKINADIEQFVLNCDTCLNFRSSNVKEPLIPTEIPEKPWMVVGTDVCHLAGKNFLIVIDYHSKYIELGQLERLDSNCTIQILKSIFARHGIPEVLRSDNATNFSSEKFEEFVKTWGIKHVTSSPTFAQSNGMIERHIQIFKNIMKKAEHDKKDLYLSLLEYRTSPIDKDIPSPAQILFNREINSLLPKFNVPLKDKSNMHKFLIKKQVKQKMYYDKSAKERDIVLKEGDRVRVQKQDKTEWQPGTVLKKLEKPRTYLVKLNNGSIVERNTKFIIRDSNERSRVTSEANELVATQHYSKPKRIIEKPVKFKDYVCKN